MQCFPKCLPKSSQEQSQFLQIITECTCEEVVLRRILHGINTHNFYQFCMDMVISNTMTSSYIYLLSNSNAEVKFGLSIMPMNLSHLINISTRGLPNSCSHLTGT